jgi:hypothetical protein
MHSAPLARVAIKRWKRLTLEFPVDALTSAFNLVCDVLTLRLVVKHEVSSYSVDSSPMSERRRYRANTGDKDLSLEQDSIQIQMF